jgi:hypothetical protein
MKKMNTTAKPIISPNTVCLVCYMKLPLEALEVIYSSCCGNTLHLDCYDTYCQSTASDRHRRRKCLACKDKLPAFGSKEAVKNIKKWARKGKSWAQFYLGKLYEYAEFGLPQSNEKALEWYNLAIKQNNPNAMLHVAFLCERGVGGSKHNPIDLYKTASNIGLAAAQYHLSCMYATGSQGIQQSIELAKKWCKVSAESGNGHASNLYSKFYDTSLSIIENGHRFAGYSIKCGTCHRRQIYQKLRPCRCKIVYYCDSICQRNNWKAHQHEHRQIVKSNKLKCKVEDHILITIRIDRRHCDLYSNQTWKSSETLPYTLTMPINATVSELKQKIMQSRYQFNLKYYNIVAVPHSRILDNDQSSLTSYLQPTKEILYCIVVAIKGVPETIQTTNDFIYCPSCTPINIIKPITNEDNKVALNTNIFKARIHDDSLAHVIGALPMSELCGLLCVHDFSGKMLPSIVTVYRNEIICTLKNKKFNEGEHYVIILHGSRLSTISLLPCCAKHTPEEHDVENQYLPFLTEGIYNETNNENTSGTTNATAATTDSTSNVSNDAVTLPVSKSNNSDSKNSSNSTSTNSRIRKKESPPAHPSTSSLKEEITAAIKDTKTTTKRSLYQPTVRKKYLPDRDNEFLKLRNWLLSINIKTDIINDLDMLGCEIPYDLVELNEHEIDEFMESTKLSNQEKISFINSYNDMIKAVNTDQIIEELVTKCNDAKKNHLDAELNDVSEDEVNRLLEIYKEAQVAVNRACVVGPNPNMLSKEMKEMKAETTIFGKRAEDIIKKKIARKISMPWWTHLHSNQEL